MSGRGRKGSSLYCVAHPKQSTEESESSDNETVALLVPSQIIHTLLKYKREGRGGKFHH